MIDLGYLRQITLARPNFISMAIDIKTGLNSPQMPLFFDEIPTSIFSNFAYLFIELLRENMLYSAIFCKSIFSYYSNNISHDILPAHKFCHY
jgi:hypothetical protein